MTETTSCRLYLTSPSDFELSKFAEDLSLALAADDAACLLLRLPDANENDLIESIETLAPICHRHDVALIVEDRIDIAANSPADGVHVAAEDYVQARDAMGDQRIVGVTSERSRHNAMEAAETKAEFVAFTDEAVETLPTHEDEEIFSHSEVISWWQSLIEVPCIAHSVSASGFSLSECTVLAKAGADFVTAGDAIWHHTDGPAAGIKAANAAISAANSVALKQST